MTDEEIIKAAKQVNGLNGMTANERLHLSGLMNKFDNALKSNQEKARRILELLQIDNPSIEKIIQ